MGKYKVKIEKGVPIPTLRTEKDYPYPDMVVGDSFKVEGVTLNQMCYQNRKWSRKLGWQFTTKKDGNGVRVWRIE